jgi:small subunit ribosomal protein S9
VAEKYFESVGRRKKSTARVRIYEGKKPSVINNRPVQEYFAKADDKKAVVEPFAVLGLDSKFYFTAKVSGGGTTGQAGAIQLGVARALFKMDPELKSPLRKKGLITRDPRMVERKKYNQKKARAKNQFSKR